MRILRHLLPATLFACTNGLFAQAPQAFSYQAVARDLDGDALNDVAIAVRFHLHQGTAAGPVVFAEQHGTTTNDHGLFTLQVGNGAPITGTLGGVDWSSGPYFMEVSLDDSLNGTFTSMGTQQLLSVPYALHAGSSGDLPHGTEVGQIMHWNGTAWVVDSGLYVHSRRFGVGIQQPESPLAIKAEGSNESLISFHDDNGSALWRFKRKGYDTLAFSIDEATAVGSQSRLFIANGTGNVGIGTETPQAPLSMKSRDELHIKFENGDIPDQDDFAFTTGGNGGFALEEDTTGGLVSRLHIQSGTGHVGIGTNDPPAPLSIVSRNVLKTYFQTGDFPTQQQFAIRTDSTGFDIGQGLPNSIASRLFIDNATQGNIGIGTIHPQQKLHIRSSTPNGITGIGLLNTASSSNDGWTIGHLHDNSVTERMKTFAIQEKKGADLLERITILTSGNVGINEPLPYATLHVTKQIADPTESIDLTENTGIVMLGPLEQHLVMDSRSIQARHLLAGTTSVVGAPGSLRLQPLGGDLTVHGSSLLEAEKILITNDGKLGLGTVAPLEKLHINGAVIIGNTLQTTPADGTIRYNGTDFEGWTAGDWAIFNGTEWQKVDNTEDIYYNTGTTPRVGIGTSTPDTRLHVSRPISDPQTPVALAENTGITVIGPITDNLVFDHRGIQARHGDYVAGGSTLSLSSSGLHLQPLGGNILLHGDDASLSSKGIVTGQGNLGLGTLTPLERIHIDGAIKIGTTATANEGTIRFTGTDFEGYTAGEWVPLNTWRRVISSNDIHHNARVGIGTSTPTARIDVQDSDASAGNSIAASLLNTSTTSSSSPNDHRLGLRITNSGAWGGNPTSKDVGLYVSNVSGQSSANGNLAAVLNGNTVIGDLTTGSVIGTGGTRVLAIQSGAAPSTAVGGGIQIYSADLPGIGSTFHLMTGDGAVMKLYRQPDLTTADASSVGSTYDASTAALIVNMRTRINELENILKSLGVLSP